MFARLAQIDFGIADIERMILLERDHPAGSTKRYRHSEPGKAGLAC
jgi:hypothetical protein